MLPPFSKIFSAFVIKQKRTRNARLRIILARTIFVFNLL